MCVCAWREGKRWGLLRKNVLKYLGCVGRVGERERGEEVYAHTCVCVERGREVTCGAVEILIAWCVGV